MKDQFKLTLSLALLGLVLPMSACSAARAKPIDTAPPAPQLAQSSATTELAAPESTSESLRTESQSSGISPIAALNIDPDLNMCEGLVTHTERMAIKAVAKPPYLKHYREPAFNTKVIRVTNSRKGESQKPAYSTMQAWNADESLLMLYRSGLDQGTHILLDGHTYEPIRALNIVPSDLEEVYWSHKDPDIFYYVSKYSSDIGLFKKYNVKTNKTRVVKDFSKQCGFRSMPTGGGDVHMQSLDDDFWGFRCRKEDGNWIMLTYRISTDEVSVKRIGDGTPWESWLAPTPGPSGKTLFYQGTSLDPDLTNIRHKLDMAKAWEHSNVGQTYNGQDAIFSTVFDPSPKGCDGDIRQGVGHLTEFNLETGKCRPIISESNGYPYTTSGTHVSARAIHKPGWIAMSSVGYDQFRWFTNGRKAPVLFSEIYLANTDPDNTVICRLAHHRSYAKHAKNAPYKAYFGEPHATISPSGTRIIFGSDWYDSGSVDSYVIELPGYQKPN
ncbi:MAG: hypothetical protein KTR35_03865 [Gammaproteobacteria bacterium]|nr:hypothetical protein [Gammaproteobacteria bacterium]